MNPRGDAIVPWHSCPREGCDAATAIASEDDLIDGAPLWSCDEGHHGPRVIGYSGSAH